MQSGRLPPLAHLRMTHITLSGAGIKSFLCVVELRRSLDDRSSGESAACLRARRRGN